MPADSDPRRRVPRTDSILADVRLVEPLARLGRSVVKEGIARAQERVRSGRLDPDDLVPWVVAELPTTATTLCPVINATGVLLHTNLGRAPLSRAAIDAAVMAAGTVDLEVDLTTGHRGPRAPGAARALLAAVPSAEAAHVVNNGAAALLLAATVLSRDGKELLISRGELVEIGDGFRIPDLLRSTGARLREVGTTNRTSVRDFEDALGPDTAAIIRVHPSNFLIVGFTTSADVGELATLPVPLVVDIGSGLLAPDPLLPDEPDAETTLSRGADLVMASGDKLLGGPQAGLVLGSSGLVHRLRRDPLARALRADKLTLAALEATLRGPRTPTRLALDADVAVLRERATALADRMRAAGIPVLVVDSVAQVGGGGAPGVGLPSAALALPEAMARSLRRGVPAVLGRVERDRCVLDLRAVPPARDDDLLSAILAVHAEAG